MADLMAPHDDTLDALRSVRRGAARCAHGPISLCSFHIVCVLCVVCCFMLFGCVDQWLTDEGVPSGSVHLSPWKDHLFVDTDVDTAQRLLQMPLHAYRHSSSDPEVVGKLVVAADSGELPASHPHASRVAIVRVAGSVSAPTVGMEAATTLQTELLRYPFSFWPPSPVLEAEVMNNGELRMQAAVTCSSWATKSYPFVGSVPDFNATAPCGTQEGQIQSFTVTVTNTTGGQQTDTWDVTWDADSTDIGCAIHSFVVDVCANSNCVGEPNHEILPITVCSFKLSALTFELDEQ